MKGKSLLVLVVVLAGVVGLAYWTSSQKARRRAPPALVGTLVFADLPVNDVERITLQRADGTVTVARAEGVWGAPGKYGYPVKFEKVRDFLRALAEMKVGQVVRSSEAGLRSMKLLPPAAGTNVQGAAGTLVTLADGKGRTVGSMVLGDTLKKSSPRRGGDMDDFGGYPSGRYLAVGEKVFLVSEMFNDVPQKANDWFEEELVNVHSSDLLEIEVTGPGRETVTIRRPKEGEDWKLEGLPSGEEAESSKVVSLSGAMNYLRFQDVADPALKDAQTGFDKPVVFKARAKDGKTFTVKLGKAAEGASSGRYMRMSAEYVPPAVVSSNAPAGTNAPAAKTEDAKKAEREKLAGEVRALNERHAKWTYVISEYSGNSFLAERKEFIKKKEEKKDEPKKDEAKKDDVKKDEAK